MANVKLRVATGLAVAASMAASLTACSDSGSDGDGTSTISVAVFAGGVGLPWLVGQQEGFFTDHGVKVKTTSFTSGPAIAAALTSHSMDVGYMGASIAYQTVKQTSGISVLDDWNQTNFAVVAVNSAKASSSIADGYPAGVRSLKGLKIGVPALGGQVQVMFSGMLQQAGVDPKDVTFIATGATPTAIAALKNGKVDANTTTWDGLVPMKAAGLDVEPVVDASDPQDAGPGIAESIFSYDMASSAFVSDHTKLGKYCGAMQDSIKWITDPANAEAGSQILAKADGISVDEAKAAWSKVAMTYHVGLTQSQWESQPAWATGGEAPSYAKTVTSCVS